MKSIKRKKKDVDIDVDVELDVDAKAIVNLLSNNDSSCANFAPILDDSRQFINQIPSLKINQCFREAKAYADVLAKKGSHF